MQNNSFNPSSLTSKDIEDLKHVAHSSAFDAVALSFVAKPDTVAEARSILRSTNCDLPIIAKIETAQGMQNIHTIVETADMVMAARGDLALSIDWVELPAAVQQIAQISDEKGKPWILATQVMEGLERFIFPTRAEICDLAHWLTEGASGVMLSYETAFGSKPVEAITAVARMMDRWSNWQG